MPRETEFLDLIEKAYDGAFDQIKWQDFLNSSADVFGAVGARAESAHTVSV